MMLNMVVTAPMMAIGGVVLALSQDASLAWVGPVVAAGAAAMGGRLEESCREGIVRAALVLPKETPP